MIINQSAVAWQTSSSSTTKKKQLESRQDEHKWTWGQTKSHHLRSLVLKIFMHRILNYHDDFIAWYCKDASTTKEWKSFFLRISLVIILLCVTHMNFATVRNFIHDNDLPRVFSDCRESENRATFQHFDETKNHMQSRTRTKTGLFRLFQSVTKSLHTTSNECWWYQFLLHEYFDVITSEIFSQFHTSLWIYVNDYVMCDEITQSSISPDDSRFFFYCCADNVTADTAQISNESRDDNLFLQPTKPKSSSCETIKHVSLSNSLF